MKSLSKKEFDAITKEQFDAAYNAHLPGPWIKFAFRYFSKSTVEEDFAPRQIIVGILLGLFGVGFLGTILKWGREILFPVTVGYSILLAVLVLYLFSAVFANNARLKKCMKILGCSKWQWNQLVEKYFDK